MRVLLLTHSFNSLAQRLFAELVQRGDAVSVEFDISDAVTEEAVRLFEPDVLVAPFLKRAIPSSVLERLPCLIVHPGIVGDRGPSALDWAIDRGERAWGVTVLQATAEFDAGPVWAERRFPMRAAAKSSLYRFEVTEAAVAAVLDALERLRRGEAAVAADRWPLPHGSPRPPMKQAHRAIDWERDDTARIAQRIRAADGSPGVLDRLLDVPCRLFDARPEPDPRLRAPAAAPGTAIARRHGALLVQTRDAAVWVGHVKRADGGEDEFKLPATFALPAARRLPAVPEALATAADEMRYEEYQDVGWLEFDFYNGAASTAQCERLAGAIAQALARPTRVLVLAGGEEFFCNGIHLNMIEAAESPAEESWRNIQAIDEVARAILECDDRLTVSLLRGNAGAGGVFLALAADQVWARAGVVLNPHYKNMGNLYGSEYWTYSLPRRVGPEAAKDVLAHRLPLLAGAALQAGLIDHVIEPLQGSAQSLRSQAQARALALADSPEWAGRLAAKRARRRADQSARPLQQYRDHELEQMRRNFFGFDPSYHVARSNFVRKVAHSWTPRHLALHR